MARMARLVVPHHPHHVTQRGNRRQKVFFSDSDYARYRSWLAESCAEAGTRVWAYCLMPNHVHLILVPEKEDGLRAAMAEAHRRYTRYINFKHDWCGHLWQERYFSCVLDERHLLAAVRYVERNPVAAGLCREPWDWPWSSARSHLQGVDDKLVEASPMLSLVHDWHDYLQTTMPSAEQEALQRNTRSGRPLGDESFIEMLEAQTGRTLRPGKRGPKPAGKN